jgi:hypothetical protein
MSNQVFLCFPRKHYYRCANRLMCLELLRFDLLSDSLLIVGKNNLASK